MLKFEPLFNNILVKPAAEQEKDGSIFIPEISREKPREGTVIAAGPGHYQEGAFIPSCLKEGDQVLFSKFAGTDVVINGEDCKIMAETEVLGKIVREPVVLKGVRLVPTEGRMFEMSAVTD